MSHDPQNDVIRLDGLRKDFGHIAALKGVTLTVRRGEIFGLLGSNGAGKTTLIKTLVGSIRPTSGEVIVMGMNPIRESNAVRRRIGYMPQAPALYEDLSPSDNLRFFATPHGLDDLDRRADEVLDFINLRSRQHEPVYGFSGGMKQRVSLACALVHRPELLLLDDPTAGVDPKLREAFWRHFRDLAAAGTTLLVSTHQMDEVLHCDRAAVMRDGILLVSETPRDLLARGHATIRIGRGGHVESATVSEYRTQLPQLLRQHGLDPAIASIEVEQDTMEIIVLRQIQADESPRASTKEVTDAGRA